MGFSGDKALFRDETLRTVFSRKGLITGDDPPAIAVLANMQAGFFLGDLGAENSAHSLVQFINGAHAGRTLDPSRERSKTF